MKKITLQVITSILLDVELKKDWGDEQQKLSQKKLAILNKILFGEELISFNGNFTFKTNKVFEKNIDLEYVSYYITDILKRLNDLELPLSKGEMTTTQEIVNFKNEINEFVSNRVIMSHEEQVKNEYKRLIKDTLMLLYFVPYSRTAPAQEIRFSLNEMATEEESEILDS